MKALVGALLSAGMSIGFAGAGEAASKKQAEPRGTIQCGHNVGQILQPKSFDEAVAPFASVPAKSEFETTAQYEARKAAALGGSAGGPVVIALQPTDRKFLEYNADTQVLSVIRYAFDNGGFSAWEAFYAAGLYNKIEVSPTYNVDLVVSSDDQESGTYEASNAYGAKAQIVKINRTSKVIFEREAKAFDDGLFPHASKAPYAVGQLQLSPEQAMALKPQLKLAISVVPKEPFLVTGTHKTGETTIRNPTDISESFAILVGDFQCGFVMDGENKVLGAYSAR